MLPPHSRETNHAAEQLIALLCDEATDALISACAYPKVRRAVVKLLAALMEARK